MHKNGEGEAKHLVFDVYNNSPLVQSYWYIHVCLISLSCVA